MSDPNQADCIMENPIYGEQSQIGDLGITDVQLKAEVDRLTAKLDDLDPVSAEYEATSILRSSFEDIRSVKGYSEELSKPEHPDLSFFQEAFAAAQDYGQGDYGIADVELGNGITLRGSHGGGRIFKDGETIVQYESLNSGSYGIDHPIKVKGSISPELKQQIKLEIDGLGKFTSRDDSLPPGYSRDPAALEALIDRVQQKRGMDEPVEDVASKEPEPLQNDWNNLYVRSSNLLDERGVGELYNSHPSNGVQVLQVKQDKELRKPRSSDLYQYLLSPLDFARHLYELDPTVSCGLVGIDGSTTLGKYIARDLNHRTDAKGSVLVSDWVTSWHPWEKSQHVIWAVNPRWVRVFNKRLSRLSGGESDACIMPCTALSQLGPVLGIEFPESPFAGADTCYGKNIDDLPYDLPHDLDNYQFTKTTEVCHEGMRYVILSFQLGLIEKYISFNVPQYFFLHVGFQDRINSKVKNVKITEAFGDNISKIILTFENDHKIAVPNQGGIQVDDHTYDNIPF